MLNRMKTALLNSCALGMGHIQDQRRKLKSNEDGVAAIEFALIAPIMIMMYFGLAEVAYAISFDRKISHSTNVAGDLATQVSQITADDMTEIMTATLKVLSVDNVSDIKLEIASYDLDQNGNPRLVGKALMNDGPQQFKHFDPASLDSRILNENSGVVVARIAYDFEPIKVKYFKSNFTLRENFLLKPRKSARVDIGDAIGTEISCSASTENNVVCGGSAN